MKHLDKVTQRILAVSLSLMGLILCSTLFVATINPATANTNNAPLMGGSDNDNGRIMMDYTSVHVPSQDKTYYEVLVWDSSNGASKLYYFDYTAKAFEAYEESVQLPRYPLD